MVCGWNDHSQGNAHLFGTRVGIVAARTIRRLPTSEREESSLVPVARRPADAAAGDAPTVTRHAVEQSEVIVVPAISAPPLQADSGEGVSASSNPVPNLPEPTVARAQPSSASSQQAKSRDRVDSFWSWKRGAHGEVLQSKTMMKDSLQRDREDDPRRTAGQVRDHQNTQLGVQAATVAGTITC